MFAGVGPFSVPAAKKQCIVHANDLNPESFKWLQYNAKLNKVAERFSAYNKDGRDFVKDIVKPDLLQQWQKSDNNEASLHIIMNLPALAIEFLDCFCNLMADVDYEQVNHFVMPMVHCHSFSKSATPEDDIHQRVEQILNCKLPESCYTKLVRRVAPNKDMVCISFPLEKEVLFGVNDNLEPKVKKRKEN